MFLVMCPRNCNRTLTQPNPTKPTVDQLEQRFRDYIRTATNGHDQRSTRLTIQTEELQA